MLRISAEGLQWQTWHGFDILALVRAIAEAKTHNLGPELQCLLKVMEDLSIDFSGCKK